MKIALVSTYIPFVYGGAQNIVEWLQKKLEEVGHQVELVYLPQLDEPDLLIRQMMAFRWVDIQAADRLISFRPEAHLVPHRNKILWFIHHVRNFYDLWDTPYRGFPDDAKHRAIRDALRHVDNVGFSEAKAIYTNSQVVSNRLKLYNKVDSEVLYPPIFEPERFYCAEFGEEIVCICRLEHHKRQHLLVEAMKYTRTPVRLSLLGVCGGDAYLGELNRKISEYGLSNRVELSNRWVTEEEKSYRLARCLSVAYLPLDEDSYGYPSLEASYSFKPILTTSDSGGVLELVQDGVNGYVVDPEPEALARAMDELFLSRANTIGMGRNAYERLAELNISWSHVLERLLS